MRYRQLLKRLCTLSVMSFGLSIVPALAASNAPGITNDTIKIGHLGPQTGPVAIYDEVRQGILSYFNYINHQGGVKGRNLELIAYDDEYQPAKTVKFANRLVEKDKVFAVLGPVCTPCNKAARKIYEKSGVPVIMLSTGDDEFVDPPIKNYYGSSIVNYGYEARILANTAVNTFDAKNIAIAFQDDGYGRPVREKAIGVLNELKANVVAEVPFNATDVDLTSQALKIRAAEPDLIFIFSVPAPAAKLKKALYDIDYKDAVVIASSVAANSNQLFDLAGEAVWNGTYSTTALPMAEALPDSQRVPYLAQLHNDFPKTDPDGWPQIGWAIGQTLAHAMESSEELTWDSLFNSLEKNFTEWKGSMYAGVTFTAQNRYGLTSMVLTQAQNGKIVPVSDVFSFDPISGEMEYPELHSKQ